jgi:hypothetical protein
LNIPCAFFSSAASSASAHPAIRTAVQTAFNVYLHRRFLHAVGRTYPQSNCLACHAPSVALAIALADELLVSWRMPADARGDKE